MTKGLVEKTERIIFRPLNQEDFSPSSGRVFTGQLFIFLRFPCRGISRLNQRTQVSQYIFNSFQYVMAGAHEAPGDGETQLKPSTMHFIQRASEWNNC